MLRTFHGGHCCGITTIFGFGYQASHMMPPTSPRTSADNKGTLLYPEAAMPQETVVQRFERLIYLTEKTRYTGIIEVVLTSAQLSRKETPETKTWAEELTRLGFKLVNSHTNSNTMRMLNVFHRNSGADAPKIAEPKWVKAEVVAKPAPWSAQLS